MEWLEQAAQLTIVLGFIGGVLGGIFNYVVIRPLTSSITILSEAVTELRDNLKNNNERLNRLEGSVERIEKAVVTAHARIDKFLHGEKNHEMGH